MNYERIFSLITFLMVIYILMFKKENMSNTDVKKLIEENYKIDVNSIRNLSKLANDLTSNGKLVVPGGLEVKGGINLDGNLISNGNIHSNKEISAKKGLYTNCKNYGAPSNNCGVHIRPDGQIKALSLDIKNNAEFGTGSGRKLMITSSRSGNEQTYFGFYNGSTRTNYLLPKTNGELFNHKSLNVGGKLIGNSIYSKNHLGAAGEIAAKKGVFGLCGKINDNGYGNSCKETVYKNTGFNLIFKTNKGQIFTVGKHGDYRSDDKFIATHPAFSYKTPGKRNVFEIVQSSSTDRTNYKT